jgi:Holliday junction DNA helicase RuvB
VFDVSLRPPAFDDFVGQPKVVELLTMRVEAARQRGDVLDHVLLCGPPGLGKTSLAHIIAATVGSTITRATARRSKKAAISRRS